MKPKSSLLLLSLLLMVLASCSIQEKGRSGSTIPVILDTDANNELDDQHALAYLLLNPESFQTVGITVNATRNGGPIAEHVKEADRVIRLCGMEGKVILKAGADGDFTSIRTQLNQADYDGKEAVDFIVAEAMKARSSQLVLLPVGKLTNIALALEKEPAIADKVRIVWLGSNYPDPGEYNLVDDTAALSYILNCDVPFELVTVGYGKPSGTAAVMVSRTEVYEKMPGLGPQIGEAVEGRHGGSFHNFGDYSVNLFEHIGYLEEGDKRSLFDMAAVAIVKNPQWAGSREIPCPAYIDNAWIERPGNSRKITVWENFNREAILADFYATFQ